MQLPGSQRRRCAVSILNYFLIEVFSFPLSLVCSFRGRNVLKDGGFVTPHPEMVYGMCNHRVSYVHQGSNSKTIGIFYEFLGDKSSITSGTRFLQKS